MNLKEALAKLESLGDEKRRAFNRKPAPHGIPAGKLKQFGCATGDIRALAKKIKTDHALAMELWKTPGGANIDAQLLAILLMKPKELSAKEIDTMVREARFPWVADWLQSYIIKEQPPDVKESLREKWMKKTEKAPHGWAARAGWHLTASNINQGDDDDLDVSGLLDRIEKEMLKAKPETKWTMNNTLAAIAIKRALAIGEKIGLYKDWPVSKGCTIPYVPVWVNAMVKGKG